MNKDQLAVAQQQYDEAERHLLKLTAGSYTVVPSVLQISAAHWHLHEAAEHLIKVYSECLQALVNDAATKTPGV